MNMVKVILLSFLGLLGLSSRAYSQEVAVRLGPDQFAINQLWTITITVKDERLRNYSNFPEVQGLVKRGTSSSSSTNYVNGKMSSSQSIIQNYQAMGEGKVVIPDFDITINNQSFSVKGKSIIATGPTQSRRSNFQDPFQDFFQQKAPSEFIEVEADAFLALTTDKNEIYLGEGITTTNRADMKFYYLGAKITEIIKQIKPENSWEENFNIDNINGEPIEIKGAPYTQYKIYQATYFPLNLEPINFPSVGLKLIKYNQVKNPSFFGRNRQEDYETFYSKPKTVKIKALPPHPLKDLVNVGSYKLREAISTEQLTTGQSFNYSFEIRGVGNISALNMPILDPNEWFEFYEPNTVQNIRRSSNRVTGSKKFDYFGIPNEPGTYDLGDFIQWIFFDPVQEKYDTLKSEIQIQVQGESRKNEYISSNDLGSFYDRIELEDNQLVSIKSGMGYKIVINLFIFAILAGGIVLFFKK
jgi:hypothetical protein